MTSATSSGARWLLNESSIHQKDWAWLVLWNIHFFNEFPYIGKSQLIFFRGVGQPPTRGVGQFLSISPAIEKWEGSRSSHPRWIHPAPSRYTPYISRVRQQALAVMDNVLSSAQCFTGGHSRSFFGYLNGIFCHGENNRFPWEISNNLNIISWKLVHQSEDIYIYMIYIYIYMYVCIINPISYATEVNQLNQGFVAPPYTSACLSAIW